MEIGRRKIKKKKKRNREKTKINLITQDKGSATKIKTEEGKFTQMERKMRDRKTEMKGQKNQDEKEKQSGENEKAKTLKRVRKKERDSEGKREIGRFLKLPESFISVVAKLSFVPLLSFTIFIIKFLEKIVLFREKKFN
jgi:hypothetical protein